MRKLALIAAVLIAQPALANDKQDFPDCDGRIHPGKQDDGMRGEASVSSIGQLRPFLGAMPLPQLLPGATQDRIAACTRALESPRLLAGQGLRRAHLLRARAAAWIEGGNGGEALKDLDLAVSATADRQADPFFRRSMGASLAMLRAMVLREGGDLAGARALVEQALADRPYSLRLQNVGAELLQDMAATGDSQTSPWSRVAKLDPAASRQALISLLDTGRYAEALGYNAAQGLAEPSPTPDPAKPAPATFDLESLSLLPRLAYAKAATGDAAGARADLEKLKKLLGPAGENSPAANSIGQTIDRLMGGLLERTGRQVDARIALSQGRNAEALALFEKQPALPSDAIALDLIGQFKVRLPAGEAAKLPESSVREAMTVSRSQNLRRLASGALLAPETPRSVVDYSKSRPNILGALVGGALSFGTTLLGGIDRTDGFRSSPQADGTIKVEFVGNTPSEPMVQEMTLLRAAELARAGGKWGFVIARRADYTRYLVTSQYGVETSRVPTGHKTELFVRYVDEGEDKARSLSAVEVIDALGPYYYEDKAAKR